MWYTFIIGNCLLVYDRGEIWVGDSFISERKSFLINSEFYCCL